MAAWADRACAAVEREIADGQPGDAVTGWVTTALGPARLMMAVALQGQGRGPGQHGRHRPDADHDPQHDQGRAPALPAGNFDVLKNPMIAPPFLADFLSR